MLNIPKRNALPLSLTLLRIFTLREKLPLSTFLLNSNQLMLSQRHMDLQYALMLWSYSTCRESEISMYFSILFYLMYFI
jgi:hypothetical protein